MLRSELDEALSQNEIMREFDDGKDSIGLAIVRAIGILCKKYCKKSDLLNLKADEIKGKCLTDVNIVGKNKFSKEDLNTHYIDDIIIKEEFSVQLYNKFKENRKTRIIKTIKEKVTIEK